MPTRADPPAEADGRLATEDAAASARQAADSAEQAESSADRADRAEHSYLSDPAAHRAEQVRQLVDEDLADDPLLDDHVQRVVAGVDDQHPLGVPGLPSTGLSPFRIGFTGAIGVALAYELLRAVVAARQVLVLVLIAAFLAVGLDPAVRWLRRRGMHRGLAVAVVLGGLVLVVVGFAAAAIPPIAEQATAFANEAPSYLDRIQNGSGVLHDFNMRYHIVDSIRQRLQSGPTLGLSAIGGVIGVGKAVLSAVFSTFTVLVLTAYLLANLPLLQRGSLRLVPRTRRPRFGLILEEVLRRIGGYVLGNLATSLVAGLTALAFLLLAGVPYAVALALFVALMDLIPLVGATIAAVVVTVVAFFVSIPVGIASAVFFIAYQQFENYILVPRVMKRTVDVSPLATVVAALIGGTLLGVVGALLAIPAAATISLVLREVVYPRLEQD